MYPSGLDMSGFSGCRGKSQRKTFLWTKKNGPLFRGPFFNILSGKRDSHLASDPLKSKGFLFLPKQEKTQFRPCFWGISRAKKEKSQGKLLGSASSHLNIVITLKASVTQVQHREASAERFSQSVLSQRFFWLPKSA
jgi:hypothetical protein